MTQTIPLNKLDPSPRNVRKTNADEDIAGLAESIRSKGLLQNLVVSPAAKGRFEVDAGGRRLRALKLLASEGHLAKNWPVPVVEIAPDAAVEASLAENLQKIAMNPADEVEAFAAIVAGYEANGMASRSERISNCARRFGVTERHVAQRLALADLAPEILDALRTATVGIAAARAYATHPDHKEQLKIFRKEEKQMWRPHDAQRIKDALSGRAYPADHRLVRYVGIDAYRSEGGRIETDLFFEEGEREICIDRGLVEKLAQAKAEEEAQKLAQAEGWLDAAVVKVWLPGWQAPATPDGYRYQWGAHETLERYERNEGIACYRLGEDGIETASGYFLPMVEAEAAAAQSHNYAAEWEARRRADAVRCRAFRLAFPSIAGTPLDGRAFWPAADTDLDYLEEDEEDGTVTAVMLVKLPRDAIDTRIAEAEALYEAELAATSEDEEPADPQEPTGDPEPSEQDPNVNDVMPQEKAA